MTDPIAQAADAIAKRSRIVALTGAGISVESGIPPFRGKGGLWEKYDPMKYAHIDAFLNNPADVWQYLFKDMKTLLDKAEPNTAHMGLARLETLGRLGTVITQNVDGLHQMAGNTDVIEFHGTFAIQRCVDCNQSLPSSRISMSALPPRCDCGGILRPDVVMFGEAIVYEHMQRSQMLASTCDVMLVIGTSATVEPAAYLPVIAKRSGAFIIEINAERTPLSGHISDLTLLGKAGAVVSRLVEAVERAQFQPRF